MDEVQFICCKIFDGSEKEIMVGDFIETFLFSGTPYSLYEILSIDESGLYVNIAYMEHETTLSTSYITNVWRKL